jgi:hypothetical protein
VDQGQTSAGGNSGHGSLKITWPAP